MNGSFSVFKAKRRGVFLCAVLAFAAPVLFVSAEDPVITFVNKTPWAVHIVAGSGRVDVCDIPPLETVRIKNTFIVETAFYPVFDIPLTPSFSLKDLRPADPDFYFQSHGGAAEQRIEITTPDDFNTPMAYVVLSNRSNAGGISLSWNESGSPVVTEEWKTTVNAGESAVYRVSPGETTYITVKPSGIKSAGFRFQRGWIYYLLFDGAAVSVQDIRPLSRAGEKGWVKTISGTDFPPRLARNPDGAVVSLWSNTDTGLNGAAFLSNGETAKTWRRNMAGFTTITAAAVSDGGSVAIAGYVENGGAGHIPVLQKQTEGGVLAANVEPSRQADRRSACFFTLARDGEGVLLAAGGADLGVNAVYKGYVRAVREDAAFTPLWEIGPAEFDALARGGLRYGEVTAAAFDPHHREWVIAGSNLEFDAMRNSVTGSYIARIDGAGRIKSIDPSFKNLLFNKIIIDRSGAYYLIGEEERAGESYGFAAKWDENGNEVWRSRDRPYAHSFYQDGLLDGENGELVLAGTMGADEPDGTGGAPFIESLNADTGELVWREVLIGPEFRGSALVSGVVQAPYYGFAVTLSGIQDGYFAPPFMIARLNARGKL